MPPSSAAGPSPSEEDFQRRHRKPSRSEFPVPARPSDVSVGDWLRCVRYFRWSERSDGAVRIVAFFGEKAASAVIPERLDGAPVRSIAVETFFDCPQLKTLTLPSRLAKIRPGAFAIPSLTAFALSPPNRRFRVVDGVLFDRSGKTLIRCPEGKTGEYAVPDGVRRIARRAFANSRLTSIRFPSSLKTIAGEAFLNAASLTSAPLPDDLERLDGNPFVGCSALKSPKLPPNLKRLRRVNFAEFYPRQPTRIELPNHLERLEAGALSNAHSLISVQLPINLKKSSLPFLALRNL